MTKLSNTKRAIIESVINKIHEPKLPRKLKKKVIGTRDERRRILKQI